MGSKARLPCRVKSFDDEFRQKNLNLLSVQSKGIMSTGIETLPRILKDATRRRVITLLSEKSSLGYTELMDALGCVSTGTLNYHLKVLGDLLTKNDAGKYMLSDKGHGSAEEKKRLKIAYTMLGGVAGLAITFFGTPILSVYSVSVGGPNLLRLIDSYIFEYVTLLAIASILGGFAGYGIGKRNKFNKPKWMRQTDEKFGF